MESGELIKGDEVVSYYPGEYRTEILNAIQKVDNEQTGLKFVKEWGFLGIISAADVQDQQWNQIQGALSYVLSIKRKENPNIRIPVRDHDELFKVVNELREEIEKHFNFPSYNYVCRPIPERERISDVLEFAQRIKDLSEVKRLLHVYVDDPYIAENEAEEWIRKLSQQQYLEYFGYLTDELDFLREIYVAGQYQKNLLPFFKFVLELIIYTASRFFSHDSLRGVWVQINIPETGDWPLKFTFKGKDNGFPVIMFDGLFRFIEYVLLVEPGPLPRLCDDPKCQQIFFPAREGQRYCPPFSGEKRSRCEQRHGQALRRERKKGVK